MPKPGDLALFTWKGPPGGLFDCLFRFVQAADASDHVHAAIVERVDGEGVHLLDIGFGGARRWTVAEAEATFGSGSVSYHAPVGLGDDQRVALQQRMAEVEDANGREPYGFGDLLIKRTLDFAHRRPDQGDSSDLVERFAAAIDEALGGERRMCGAFAKGTYALIGFDLEPPVSRSPWPAFDDEGCWDEIGDLLVSSLPAAIEELGAAADAAIDAGAIEVAQAFGALKQLAEQALRLATGEFRGVDERAGRRALVKALAGDMSDLPPAFLELATRALAEIPPLEGVTRFFTAGDAGASDQFVPTQ